MTNVQLYTYIMFMFVRESQIPIFITELQWLIISLNRSYITITIKENFFLQTSEFPDLTQNLA